MSRWSNRDAAELCYAAARHVSGWTDGHAAELPACRPPQHVRPVNSARRRTARRLRPARVANRNARQLRRHSSDLHGRNRFAGHVADAQPNRASGSGNNWQCVQPPARAAYLAGRRGAMPLQQPEPLQTGTSPNFVCAVAGTPPAATCPAGQTGTPPNCVTPPPPPPATCPTGQTGTPPNCVTPPAATCPAGQTGTPPNCVAAPPPHVRQAKSARRRTAGPRLVRLDKPARLRIVSRHPHRPPRHVRQDRRARRRIALRRRPQRVRRDKPAHRRTAELHPPQHVLTGQLGTPPNCTPAAPCAPWQTGTPGNCVDIQVTCTGGTVSQGRCSCPTGTRAVGGGNNWQCVQPTCQGGVYLPGGAGACRCNNPNHVQTGDLAEFCLRGCGDDACCNVSGRTNRHAAELCYSAGRDMPCAVKPVRHRTASRRRLRHVPPVRPVRHRIAPPPRSHVSGGSNRHAAELRHAAARDMSCWTDGHAAELPARDMPGWSNRHTAELRHAAARHMSGRPNRPHRRTAELRPPQHVPRVRPARRRIARPRRRLRRVRRGKREHRVIAGTFRSPALAAP